MKVYESKISRGQKMPSECELCSSIHKHINAGIVPENNPCFLPRPTYGFPEVALKKMNAYAPFTNSKRTIQRTCKHFSHVKSVSESYGRRHVHGKLETPFDDLKVTP